MKIREIMTADPVCCLPEDTVQKVAAAMRDKDIGAMPVVLDQGSRKLVGVITDRDLCCRALANGSNAATTRVDRIFSANPVTCREGENVSHCEDLMQEHQVRRVVVVDGEGRCIGIVAQADLALKEKPEKVSKVLAAISRRTARAPSIKAA